MQPSPARLNLLESTNGRRFLFALLYLSEGAPIGFVWWALPSLLRSQGLPIGTITSVTALATVPWALKFLVAPMIDESMHRGVSLRRWIIVCQFAMAASLLPLIGIDWVLRYEWVVGLVFAHAVFAAVQDVSIDTLAIRTVPGTEIGTVNGWMQTGMLAGRAGAAAGTTWIATAAGDPGIAIVMIVLLIAVPAIVLLSAVTIPVLPQPRVSLRRIARLALRRAGLAGLAVALLIGAGFEFFGVSAGPRLVDMGATPDTIAWFYGLMAPAGLVAGALAGGQLADRLGPLTATMASLGCMTMLLLVIVAGPPGSPAAWFSVAYVGVGLLTASSYALFMTLSRGELAATRFSLFMAMTNACEAWAAFAGGRIASFGYEQALLVLTIAGCAALVPLLTLSRTNLPKETL